MNSVAYRKNKELSVNNIGHQYNFQHLVLVTKYWYKMFKNSKTVGIIRDALYDAAERHEMAIKEMSFGEDFVHAHMEASIPNTMSVSYVVQLLKGYSSYKVFKEMPRRRLRYFKGYFWTAGYSNGSVGLRDGNMLQNYIKGQDISGQLHLAI